ncbi:SDR family NAD(P)-dependent oxidoreductase [Taibaiella chishuiensis]|uniref:NAD(P)-dependent dehydrogenase (Short-subunit alcohol dehydrogenase family) n=1 Tax=Taibaiella chishuiensis TaxID=1434707 RepID=A0A2P8D2Y3_9BACT|nr:SDR family oxidoreductase [Taibaiella chishuiensis]PSK91539.1 NAD(P)-dependent dehydrogenase (short-subunit alcohol dehydrogenase family) [Taibaiella chishuiensis]
MDLQLKGKKAFISGATQGIGFAIASQLLEEGAAVIINGSNPDKARKALDQLLQAFPGAAVTAIVADLSDREAVEKMLPQLEDIDILINNAGIFGIGDFFETADEDWYRYFEINLMSAMRLSRHLLPGMIGKGWGRIIFISSESGVNVPGNMIPYGMTKAAMSALSNGLSKLTRGTAVTVNTVLGGPTYSEGVAKAVTEIARAQQMDIAQVKDMILQQSNPHILLQRFIDPGEIANLVTYLASPRSVATNGSSLRADSGVLKVI